MFFTPYSLLLPPFPRPPPQKERGYSKNIYPCLEYVFAMFGQVLGRVHLVFTFDVEVQGGIEAAVAALLANVDCTVLVTEVYNIVHFDHPPPTLR